MKNRLHFLLTAMLTLLGVVAPAVLSGQQFNSDNYLAKPHGMATLIACYGQRNSILMTTLSAVPRWEFTAAAYLYDDDSNARTDDGYSTSLYVKYMILENAAKNGGLAIKFGTGMDPGYLDGEDRLQDAFKTFWTNTPATVTMFNNKLNWDIMPGVSMTQDFGDDDKTAWSFTYSTRFSYYPVTPKFCVAAEVFGTEGGIRAKPEIRAGVRWEPNPYAVFALSFSEEVNGNNGAGLELGMMLFAPPFFYIGKKKEAK